MYKVFTINEENKDDYKMQDKLIAFDLDDTLMSKRTMKGRQLMKGRLEKLKELFEDGIQIVVISNQLKSSIGDIKLSDLIKKFESQVEGIYMKIYVSRAKDLYRKPDIGLIDIIKKDYNNLEPYLYIGDAAGRKKDFSDSDKKFAEKAGIKFQTPEEFF